MSFALFAASDAAILSETTERMVAKCSCRTITDEALARLRGETNRKGAEMTNDPQVPWTDEQWTRVNQVIQEEAGRARVAATFLPLIGPLPGDTDFVRRELISYPAMPAALQPPPNQMFIDDRNIWQLATLQVKVRVRGAQIANSEMTSVLAMFRRAANVVARLEDAVVFTGLAQGPGASMVPTGGAPGPGQIWEITGGEVLRGLLDPANAPILIPGPPPPTGALLVTAVSQAIGNLEGGGHFGPFALVLGQRSVRSRANP